LFSLVLRFTKTERGCERGCEKRWEGERKQNLEPPLAFFLSPFSCLALYKDRGNVEEKVRERVRGRHAGRESFSE